MALRPGRMLPLSLFAALGVVALACSSGGSDARVIPPTAAPDVRTGDVRAGSATQVPEAPRPAGRSSLQEAPEGASYDSNAAMFELILNATEVLGEIERQADVSQVPVLIEVLRFMPADLRVEAASTLRGLTGQSLGPNDWPEWMEWLGGRRAEFRPPDDYARWKAALLSAIDPRFALFLGTAKETSRIDLTEVVWGGVRPDGIPDLQSPPAVSSQEADYLAREERVFGVSINGEHRAYPLRITNPHEMVNDRLGGEPIALAW